MRDNIIYVDFRAARKHKRLSDSAIFKKIKSFFSISTEKDQCKLQVFNLKHIL